MPIFQPPAITQWYRHLDKGHQFQVVALDDEAGTIEIQHFDGDLEEIDAESWHGLDIEAIQPPEDWTGPMDVAEKDDLGYTETEMSDEDWLRPLEERGEYPEQEEGAEW
jgi:hypothetical protein